MAAVPVEEAILSEALLGVEGDETGESIGNGKCYGIVRTRFEFWNILGEADYASSDDDCSEGRIDSEGDFELRRRPKCRDCLVIDHVMATTLADVGLQVWHGALLLSDYLLYRPEEASGKHVLDLGCGTGLTSICAAMAGAKRVYATDAENEALQMAHRNVLLNRHLIPHQGAAVNTRQLQWQCPLATSLEQWPEADREEVQQCSLLLAADVIYDPSLNEALFSLIDQLCSSKEDDTIVLISLEKRYNFALSHMTVACPAYEHFVDWIDGVQRKGWTAEMVETSEVPICFTYRRNKDMELWRLVRPGGLSK